MFGGCDVEMIGIMKDMFAFKDNLKTWVEDKNVHKFSLRNCTPPSGGPEIFGPESLSVGGRDCAGTNISHLGKGKIILKSALVGGYASSLQGSCSYFFVSDVNAY